jgi:hypothetical protein
MDPIGKVYPVLELQKISTIRLFMNWSHSYAELFAVYSFLIWLRNDYAISNENNLDKIPVQTSRAETKHRNTKDGT